MNKRRLKEKIYGCNIRCFSYIVGGIARREPKKLILDKVRNVINKTNVITVEEKNKLFVFMSKKYAQIYRNVRIGEENLESVYIISRGMIKELEKVKNIISDRVEFKIKLNEKNEMYKSDNVFYVCTWFSDCAKDHVGYQGKIYYNRNALITSTERACIKNRKMLSIQEVCDNYPYLMTRRNCRHSFVAVSADEVIHSSAKNIVIKHGLRFKHENEYNTVLTPNKVAYIEEYERLKALIFLKKEIPNKELEKDIKNAMARARIYKERIKKDGI